MAQRLVILQIKDEYIRGAGVSLGGAGGHDTVLLELRFSDVWTGLVKRLYWIDALGNAAEPVILTGDMAKSESIYQVSVPAAALLHEGAPTLTIQGVYIQNNIEKLKLVTEVVEFRVLSSLNDATSQSDIDPTQAEQIQQQVENMLGVVADARVAAGDAEAWGVGTIDGIDVDEEAEQYQNNSKYYAVQAGNSAAAAAASEGNAATSESNAAASEGAAETAKTAAETARDAAQASATAAAASEGNAASSATSAHQSADTASQAKIDVDASLATKADKASTDQHFKAVSFDANTGIFTFTRENGATVTFDTALEKVATNWQYDAETQSLVLTLADGTTQSVSLASFITETEFTDSDQIDFSVSGHTVTATVKAGSITEGMLASELVQQLIGYVTTAGNSATTATNKAGEASGSATAASGSATAAAGSASDAAGSASDAADSATAAAGSASAAATSEGNAEDSAEDAEAFSRGTRGGVPVGSDDETYHNNAKYWAQQAEHAASGGVASFNGRAGIVTPQSGDYTKGDVGLGNVDNTSDADKPVSTATQTALNAKQDALTFDSAPTAGSTNPVTSGGVKTAIDDAKTFWATYGETTNAEIAAAVAAGKTCLVYTSDRVFRLAYIEGTTPSRYIFTVSQWTTIYWVSCNSNGTWSNGNNALQTALTFDTTPTSGSTKPVTSGGVKTAIDAKQNTLTFDAAPTSGSTNPVTSGGVYTAIQSAGRSPVVVNFVTAEWVLNLDDDTMEIEIPVATHGITNDGILAQFYEFDSVYNVYYSKTYNSTLSWAEINSSTHVITLHAPVAYTGKVVLF